MVLHFANKQMRVEGDRKARKSRVRDRRKIRAERGAEREGIRNYQRAQSLKKMARFIIQ